MNRNYIHNRILLSALMLFLSTALVFSQKQPDRVEPPFWWAGMHHTQLQLMVYGENISQTRVSIDHPGVKLNEVVKVESPDYLFLYLDLENALPGIFTILFDGGRRNQIEYHYELKAREEGSRMRQGFNNSDAIYLLMPDRFANGDTLNDSNIPGMMENANMNDPNGRQGGDIQGIINNLDYIASMGFTALWINPLLENNQPRYSYHGYAITDFYKIDPRFGTNDDYVKLVKEAEARGVKVIKDMIFNHSGHYHWWMQNLPMADWLNQWDDFTRTTYRMTTIMDPYAAHVDFKAMTDGWFDTNMPDLNQTNRLLATYLNQNSVWWIEYSGIKGFRIDTQTYADKDFISQWGEYVHSEYPNFNSVGESWIGIPPIMAYFQGGKPRHDGYNSNMPSIFDFAMYDAIGQAFTEEQEWSTGMMRIYNLLAQDFLYTDPYNLLIFGDNHDTHRLLKRVGDRTEKMKMAITFLATTRGIPQIYTGTETLQSQWEHDGHGKMRVNFPGGWPGDSINAFTREGRTDAQNDMVDHITLLFNYRKDKAVLHTGRLKQFVPENNVYVYFRYNHDETIMVVINNNDEAKPLQTRRFAEATSGFNLAYDIISGQSFPVAEEWSIPANTAMVLELK